MSCGPTHASKTASLSWLSSMLKETMLLLLMMMMMNRFGTMCLEEQAQEEPEVEAEEVAEEVKTVDMKKAKLMQKEIASFFATAKGEAQKQEDEHKALVNDQRSDEKEEGSRQEDGRQDAAQRGCSG